MTITPQDIRAAREDYHALTALHVDQIVARASLQPEDHPIHNIEAYRDGVRVPIQLSGNLTVYVYCLPWARGWSIFTDILDKEVFSFSWRHVPVRWKHYQMPVYNARDDVGPWAAPPQQIVAALEYTVRSVKDIDRHRAPQIRRRSR